MWSVCAYFEFFVNTTDLVALFQKFEVFLCFLCHVSHVDAVAKVVNILFQRQLCVLDEFLNVERAEVGNEMISNTVHLLLLSITGIKCDHVRLGHIFDLVGKDGKGKFNIEGASML